MQHIIKDRFLKGLKKKKSLLSSSVNQELTKLPSFLELMFCKLCKKYLKLMKPSLGLGFFRNYHKNIKAICEEYEKKF